ncbi:MAG: hypothetical protein ABIG89_03205 [Candidatus Woesearchaeota archaeon]
MAKPVRMLFFILIDVIFFAAIMLSNNLFSFFFVKFRLTNLALMLFLSIINMLILILVYTLAKKKALDIIFGYKSLKALGYKDIKKFFFPEYNNIFYNRNSKFIIIFDINKPD